MDFDRKLDRPINDLDDIRIIMETQKKIRDQEIDMDMKIDLVSEIDVLLQACQNACHKLKFIPDSFSICVSFLLFVLSFILSVSSSCLSFHSNYVVKFSFYY